MREKICEKYANFQGKYVFLNEKMLKFSTFDIYLYMYKYDFYGFLNIGKRRHSSVGKQKLRRKPGKRKEF